MSLIGTLLVMMSALASPDGPSDSVEFSNLMKDLHRETRSVCFIFEGEMMALERNGQVKSRSEPTLFQGLYALRAGTKQAGLLEVYRAKSPKPPLHQSQSLLNGVHESTDYPPVEDVLDPKTKKPLMAFGGPGSLNGSPSPEWFVHAWYFWVYQFKAHPNMMFENLGWENIGDHRCLKVKLGVVPFGAASASYKVFWIDLGRGGHPLKIEKYFNGKLLYRVESIDLEQVPDVLGKKVWFPVKGVLNVYGSLSGTFHDYPMARETYGVVLGSLQLNLDLPDSAFVVHTKPRTELANAVSLKREHPVEVPPRKSKRHKTDPASVKARLDAKLADADQQAAEVAASSPARESWNMVVIVQAAIALVGVIAIVSAVLWRRRQS